MTTVHSIHTRMTAADLAHAEDLHATACAQMAAAHRAEGAAFAPLLDADESAAVAELAAAGPTGLATTRVPSFMSWWGFVEHPDDAECPDARNRLRLNARGQGAAAALDTPTPAASLENP